MSYIAELRQLAGRPSAPRRSKESLEEDIPEELGHAQRFAERINELYGVVPARWSSRPTQTYLQPP